MARSTRDPTQSLRDPTQSLRHSCSIRVVHVLHCLTRISSIWLVDMEARKASQNKASLCCDLGSGGHR